MNHSMAKHTPFSILLRIFLLASLLILPLSPTYAVLAKVPAGRPATPVLATGAPVLPRNQTLYFNGQQWGSVVCWNPYSSNCNNAMAISQADNARVTMFETPYLYDMLDGNVYPLLADGPFTWNAAKTHITFKIKAAAKWSDGTPVTAADVAYTWATHVNYGTANGGYQDSIDSITAVDAQTVQVNAKLNAGKAINPLGVAAYLSSNYVIQKAWTQKLEARSGYDAGTLMSDPANDVVYSGPYHKFFADDSKVVLVRDDNYWGKDASMWGKLPAPKYLAHMIYPNNAAGTAALKAGQVDVSQQFNYNVQDWWLEDGLPISTYLPDAPYQIGASLPTAFYNLASYGLDQVAVRKAIAIAVDYDTIVANAMTNQSATFEQVPRSLMNPSAGEQALYNQSAVASLQWAGNDIAGAEALLDAAGITDTNSDGWREYNGLTLHYVATCPNGWTDWQAAIEQVAEAGQAIGIDITTNYPEWSDYQNEVTNWPLPAGFDIFMMYNDGAGPAEPWGRVNHLLNSAYAQTSGNWTGNWGGYVNPAADALINAIPTVTDSATLKADYTQLTQIYLTDVPSFTLMYRPQSFQTVNESVWTNFPHEGDGTNPPVPPLDLTDGWSIAGLYNLVTIPTNVQASDGTFTPNVLVSWSASSGATSYEVYRADSATGTKSLLGTPATTSFPDTTATPGVTYYYWVKDCNGTNCTPYSSYDTGWRKLSPPANVRASFGNTTNKIVVSWAASSGATSYKVYRATSVSGAKSLLGSPTVTTFSDNSGKPGATYYFWVVAYRGTRYSDYSAFCTNRR
jgi:peptide/nickel transport system substrate-binding protein